jgi:hypothetical protein
MAGAKYSAGGSQEERAFGIFRVAIQVATRPRKGNIPPGVNIQP